MSITPHATVCPGPNFFIGFQKSNDERLDVGAYVTAADIFKKSHFDFSRVLSQAYWYFKYDPFNHLFDGLEVTETNQLLRRSNLRSDELRSRDIGWGHTNYPSKWIFNCPGKGAYFATL